MRQVVMLETRKGSDGVTRVTGFSWFPIAATAARIPKPGFVSAGVILDAAHALTPTEQADLESGAVLEERLSVDYPSNVSLANVQSDLAARWTTRKAAIDAEPAARQFFGRGWDGAAWTA